MAFSYNVITLSILLTMAAFANAEPGIGLDPEMTVDRMKAIWRDPKELARVNACFRNTGPCNPLHKNLAGLFPEVYKTSCSACDVRERQVFKIGARNSFLQDPTLFGAVVDRIDPDHIYLESFKNFMLDTSN